MMHSHPHVHPQQPDLEDAPFTEYQVMAQALEELLLAKGLITAEAMRQGIEATLRHVISMGGTVAAEHGIGKIKRQWLALQLSDVQLAVMRAVKRELDPAGILAPGNVFG